jgi:hypothetical protein
MVWRNARIHADELADFQALTGLPIEPLPVLAPHVFGFRLLMALLTHPRYPLPIWNALQVRNILRQHELLNPHDAFDVETGVGASRVIAKGLEVDLHTSFTQAGRTVWESIVTLYYRGAFGEPTSPAHSAPPEVNGTEIANWRAAVGQGSRFGRLTGDYNGVHLSNGYARLFGFRCAFQHPQRALGEALARLNINASRPVQRLDAWLRGQVYEGSKVTLRALASNGIVVLAVTPEDDPRPAIIARWTVDGQ